VKNFIFIKKISPQLIGDQVEVDWEASDTENETEELDD
jgi:hypothetical protein